MTKAPAAIGTLIVTNILLAGWGLMILLGDVHHVAPVVPAIGYGTALLWAFLVRIVATPTISAS